VSNGRAPRRMQGVMFENSDLRKSPQRCTVSGAEGSVASDGVPRSNC
jgi:hypothetical protein